MIVALTEISLNTNLFIAVVIGFLVYLIYKISYDYFLVSWIICFFGSLITALAFSNIQVLTGDLNISGLILCLVVTYFILIALVKTAIFFGKLEKLLGKYKK